MATMRAGDRAAAAVATAVGPWLEERGAHYGSSRRGSVSWYFPPRRRRERVLVFRDLDGATERWEVELTECSVSGPRAAPVVHASSVRRCSRAGLGDAVGDLLATGPSRRPVPARPAGVSTPVDLGSPLLGLALAVLLLAGARAEITLAPSLVALGVPLLAVSACRIVARLLRLCVRGGAP